MPHRWRAPCAIWISTRRRGPRPPDAFRYEITTLDHPRQASVLINERDVPAELRPLVEAVSKEGEPESRKSSGQQSD